MKSADTHLNSVYVKPMLYNSILKQNGSDFFLFSFFFFVLVTFVSFCTERLNQVMVPVFRNSK